MTSRKRLKLLLGIALLLILGLSVYLALDRDRVRQTFQNLVFRFEPGFELEEFERILVIAPHTDDEVLGTGGAIQRHLAHGARVVVVILTNGDGQYRRLFPSTKASINLGYTRQNESLAALAHLGLPRENVIFLGYPDRGLSDLWNSYWDCERLYTSRYTNADRSPYSDSFTPEAPYRGLSVVADLMKIIAEEQPQLIYLPHPNDLHPDHQAAWAFTVYALERLGLETELFTYIIHRERWPEPQGLRLAELLFPPPSLFALDTGWIRVDLEPEERQRKLEAIQQFHSQTKFIEDYLVSFARANELFGLVPSLRVSSALEFQEPEAEESPEASPLTSYLDPPRHGASDIRSVTLERDGEGLAISVEFFSGPLRSDEIRVHLKPLGTEAEQTFTFLEKGGKLYLNNMELLDGRVSFAREKSAFSLTVPLELLGRPSWLILGVEIARREKSLERSAYRLVLLE
ncbi:MAG: PIG-L family deacetylase [Candidatus Acetothermia bacterium]|jgi:LmbE family N-acetylglucosaminyl deacetylase|nr:PIG-L family deacetylase [Candidatus Acetothermia bacterium]MDH7504977.1 PIG-L family deacetylase [Candidatus Acetothermia bacterium]